MGEKDCVAYQGYVKRASLDKEGGSLYLGRPVTYTVGASGHMLSNRRELPVDGVMLRIENVSALWLQT